VFGFEHLNFPFQINEVGFQGSSGVRIRTFFEPPAGFGTPLRKFKLINIFKYL